MAISAAFAISLLGSSSAAGETAEGAQIRALPRTPDGTPDIQGVWQIKGFFGGYSIEDPGIQLIYQNVGVRPGRAETKVKSRIVDPPDGKVPYQAWARARQQEIFKNHLDPKLEHLDPQARCFLTGVPRPLYMTQYQILQSPGYVTILFEYMHAYRVIPLHGRPHVGESIDLWMGDSRGRWEGNTLLVDVANFNDKWWFDFVGSFHSDALHITERYTVVDADTIDYEATVEDPKVYTRPWTMAFSIMRIKEPGYELMEHACWEGNRFVDGLRRSSSPEANKQR